MNPSFSAPAQPKKIPQSKLTSHAYSEPSSYPTPSSSMIVEETVQQQVNRLKDEGNTLAEAGLFVRALNKWNESLELDPKNAVLHELKAQVLMEMNQEEQALESARLGVMYAPDWYEAYITLARVLLNMGELDLSKNTLEQALELCKNPKPNQSNLPISTLSTEIEEEIDSIEHLLDLKAQIELSQTQTETTQTPNKMVEDEKP